MPHSGSLEFGNRVESGKVKRISNLPSGSSFPEIKNREFSEVHDFIVQSSEDGASIPVKDHLTALFQVVPTAVVDSKRPAYTTLHIQAGTGYNSDRFISDINTAVGFGYTIVEQDTPLKSWKVFYISLGNNIYCVTFSSTFRKITVSSRT